jgi:hypothetical protein
MDWTYGLYSEPTIDPAYPRANLGYLSLKGDFQWLEELNIETDASMIDYPEHEVTHWMDELEDSARQLGLTLPPAFPKLMQNMGLRARLLGTFDAFTRPEFLKVRRIFDRGDEKEIAAEGYVVDVVEDYYHDRYSWVHVYLDTAGRYCVLETERVFNYHAEYNVDGRYGPGPLLSPPEMKLGVRAVPDEVFNEASPTLLNTNFELWVAEIVFRRWLGWVRA